MPGKVIRVDRGRPQSPDRKKPQKKRKRKGPRIFFTILLLLLILVPAGYFGWQALKVETAKFEGETKLSQEQLAQSAKVPIGENIFFVDIDQIVKNLQAVPTLQVISVTREYPDTIAIVVRDKKPAGAIAHEGGFAIVDQDGLLMEIVPDFDKTACPQIVGLGATGFSVGEVLATEPEQQLKQLTRVLTALSASKVVGDIETIDMTEPSQIKMLTRGDGVKILMGQAVDCEKKLGWIEQALPPLRAMGRTGGTLDVTMEDFANYQPDGLPSPSPTPDPSGSPDPNGSPDTSGSPEPSGSKEPDESPSPSPSTNHKGEPMDPEDPED